VDWIDLARERDQWKAFMNMVLDLWVPENIEKFLSGCSVGGSSSRAQLRK
jgi:hypothetical protein